MLQRVRAGLRAEDHSSGPLRASPSTVHRHPVRAPRGLQTGTSSRALPVRTFVRLCGTFMRSTLLRLRSPAEIGFGQPLSAPASRETCRGIFLDSRVHYRTWHCETASDNRLRFRNLNSRAHSSIIRFMKAKPHHAWNVTPAEARAIQEKLRSEVSAKNAPSLKNIEHVAGIDISIRNDRAIAAIVVLDFETLQIVDFATHEADIPFPYVPGLLSFRECPSILAAAEKLRIEPDLIMVDGQGIAHPRRLGIATHLGLLFDKPTIGCAKTRLTGKHEEPALEAGSCVDLWDRDELIGAVLRTKKKCRPLYISIGHKIDLPMAIKLVLVCGRGYRLPEPTRMAHQVAGGKVPSLLARNLINTRAKKS